MKILIISGFLGAGKTTFIKALAERSKRDFVVLENEFGGTNLDSQDLQSSTDQEMNIWELTEGCVCCSTKEEFAASVLTIANSLDPEFLIVEPTGLAKLGVLIDNLRKIQYENIVLLQPLVILDGLIASEEGGSFNDVWRDQLRHAGTMVFSKTESLGSGALAELETAARKRNPTSDIVAAHYSKQPDEWFSGLLDKVLDKEYRTLVEGHSHAEVHAESLALQDVALACPEELVLFLQGVTAGTFGDIVRAKGCLHAGGQWLRFDVVGPTYAITGAEEDMDEQAVFIGQDLHRTWLRQIMQPAMRQMKGGDVAS